MKKRIIAMLTAVMCLAGTAVVTGMNTVYAAGNVQDSTEQPDALESIISAVDSFLAENHIEGKTFLSLKNGNPVVGIKVIKDSDAKLIQKFIETQGMNQELIDLLSLESGFAENYAASIRTYMTENNIKGYVYQKQGSNVLVIVCKTAENIESVKAYAAEKGFKPELLEYTLPDFEVNPPTQLSGNLEEYRQVIEDFVKQRGINCTTMIRERKGEDRIWVILDTLKDEYTLMIEYFLSEYGIDADSVIIDVVTTEAMIPAQTTEPTPGTTLLVKAEKYGDVNCNGNVTVADAVMLARIVAEDATVSVTPSGLRNADMDDSGAPDQDDIVLLLRTLAGIK